MTHHPHVHCVVPGGGLSPDGKWIACKPGFFLPVKPLAPLFRGAVSRGLKAAFENGALRFFNDLAPLAGPPAANPSRSLVPDAMQADSRQTEAVRFIATELFSMPDKQRLSSYRLSRH